MSFREVRRVCYDAEYFSTLECPTKGEHAGSIAALGAVGIVPGGGFVHACGCMANGVERQMIREFRTRLGSGNAFFLEEIKARLQRYMFSEHLPAGVNLYVPGHGLIVYYNWAYAQKTMVGRLHGGEFFPPSTGEAVTDELPKGSPGLVFPFLFGDSGTADTLGALMGSTRVLGRAIAEARQRSRISWIKGGKGCVCDVSVYVIHSRLPCVGDYLPCGCRTSNDHIKGIRSYLYKRQDEVRAGGKWELDFSIFARVLRRTGAVLHWQKKLGVLCLFSSEVTRSDITMMFHPDRLEVHCDGNVNELPASAKTCRLDRLIQRSYHSALPTCRYLQYHR